MALSYVLVAAITAATTLMVNKTRSSVELVTARAGNARLRQENEEQERRNRQLVYEELAHVTQDIFEVLGTRLDDPENQKQFSRFVRLSTKVALYGPPSVREAMGSLNDVYNEFWHALRAERQRHPARAEAVCWQAATHELQEKFTRSTKKLLVQMNADITRRIAENSLRASRKLSLS